MCHLFIECLEWVQHCYRNKSFELKSILKLMFYSLNTFLLSSLSISLPVWNTFSAFRGISSLIIHHIRIKTEMYSDGRTCCSWNRRVWNESLWGHLHVFSWSLQVIKVIWMGGKSLMSVYTHNKCEIQCFICTLCTMHECKDWLSAFCNLINGEKGKSLWWRYVYLQHESTDWLYLSVCNDVHEESDQR